MHYKTNLGRLLAFGDDWDTLSLMSESSMLAFKAAELREACMPTAKYTVKKGRKIKGGRDRNEMNNMEDRRHMSVFTQQQTSKDVKGEGEGGRENKVEQTKNCGCEIS